MLMTAHFLIGAERRHPHIPKIFQTAPQRDHGHACYADIKADGPFFEKPVHDTACRLQAGGRAAESTTACTFSTVLMGFKRSVSRAGCAAHIHAANRAILRKHNAYTPSQSDFPPVPPLLLLYIKDISLYSSDSFLSKRSFPLDFSCFSFVNIKHAPNRLSADSMRVKEFLEGTPWGHISGAGGSSDRGRICGVKMPLCPFWRRACLWWDEVVLETAADSRCFADAGNFAGAWLLCYADGADGGERQPRDADDRALRRSRAKNAFFILFLGAMLAEAVRAGLRIPGGRAIGKRPIDLHLAAFHRHGAFPLRRKTRFLIAGVERLQGCRIDLPFPSVGCNEIVLVRGGAEGVTVLHNAAISRRFLRAMGAEIYGEERAAFFDRGGEAAARRFSRFLRTVSRAGTFLCAAAMTGGELCLKDWSRGAAARFRKPCG